MILAAARRQFATLGYDRASLRLIAAEAEVDQRLIAYFFGSKDNLFVAAVGLPYPPEAILPALVGDREGVGERLAKLMVGRLDDPVFRSRVVGLIRAAASSPQAAKMILALRESAIDGAGDQLAAVIDVDEMRLRLALVNAHLMGLVMTRDVIGAEPLASMTLGELGELVAPAFQAALTAPVPRR